MQGLLMYVGHYAYCDDETQFFCSLDYWVNLLDQQNADHDTSSYRQSRWAGLRGGCPSVKIIIYDIPIILPLCCVQNVVTWRLQVVFGSK